MRSYRIHILALLGLSVFAFIEWTKTPESPSASHVLPAPVKARPFPKSMDTAAQPPSEKPLKSNLQDVSEIRAKLFADHAVQNFMRTWQDEEKATSRLLPTHNRSGRQVLVLIPPISGEAKVGLLNSISNIVKERFGSETREVRERMRNDLLEWVAPSDLERVVEITYDSSLDNQFELLSGRWLDVEDSSKFKDEAYYMDYGKIINDGVIGKERLIERYGNFFTVQDEPHNP